MSCIDSSPDGRLIALGTSTYTGGTLEIWNWRDGSRKLFEKFNSLVRGIRFSPDGQYSAVWLVAGDILLWNVRTGKCVKNLPGHYDQLIGVAFIPDGGLVSVSRDLTVKSWDSSFLGSESKSLESSPAVRDLNTLAHKVCRFYYLLQLHYLSLCFPS
jgi:WD40 repeat protein